MILSMELDVNIVKDLYNSDIGMIVFNSRIQMLNCFIVRYTLGSSCLLFYFILKTVLHCIVKEHGL